MSSRLDASDARRKRSLFEREQSAHNDDNDDGHVGDLRPAREDESKFRASRQREIAQLNQLSAKTVANVSTAVIDEDEGQDDDDDDDKSVDRNRVEIDAELLQNAAGDVDGDDDEFEDTQWEDGENVEHDVVGSASKKEDEDDGAIEVTLDLNAEKRKVTDVNKDGKPKRVAAPRRTKAEKDADLEQHRMHLTLMAAHVDAIDALTDDALLQARLLSLLPAELVANCTCTQKEMTEQQLLDGASVNHPATVMLVPLMSYVRDHCDSAAMARGSAALDVDGSAENTSDLSSADKVFASVYNGVELNITNHRDAAVVFGAIARALAWSTRVTYCAVPHPLEPPKKPKSKAPAKPKVEQAAGAATTSAATVKRRRSAPTVKSKFFETGASQPVAATQPTPKRKRSTSSAIVVDADEDDDDEKPVASDSDFASLPKSAAVAPAKKTGVIELSSDTDEEAHVGGDEPDEDEDEKPAPKRRLRAAPAKKQRAKASSETELLSTLYFCQVWCEAQCAWTVADVVNGVWEFTLQRTVPYVLSGDHGAVLDETLTYAKDWAAAYQLRMSADEDVLWLEQLLGTFLQRERSAAYRAAHGVLVARQSTADDTTRQTALASVPLPTRVTDFRRHPVYALGRFLTKYQAVHPSTTAGEFRNEPVYWRKNVHMLHTAEKWLQEGRAPRPGEQPVKRVTSRTRGGKGLVSVNIQEARDADGQRQEEADGSATVGAFGRWQTELYQPPHVVGGKVPRNSYGNVYLFKPAMVPVGGVHLRLPGIRAVASRLGIDAPPAQTGWDTHGGRSFPQLDGAVVPVEHEQVLREAWQAAQIAKNERDSKKRRAKALKNWMHLCAGVMARARLAKAYEELAPKEQPK